MLIGMLPAPSDLDCSAAPVGRFTTRPSSFTKTAVMMKKISRLRTKSSIGARSMPWLSPTCFMCLRSRISEVELIREKLGFPLRAQLEVVHRVQARDAHGQPAERADHG